METLDIKSSSDIQGNVATVTVRLPLVSVIFGLIAAGEAEQPALCIKPEVLEENISEMQETHISWDTGFYKYRSPSHWVNTHLRHALSVTLLPFYFCFYSPLSSGGFFFVLLLQNKVCSVIPSAPPSPLKSNPGGQTRFFFRLAWWRVKLYARVCKTFTHRSVQTKHFDWTGGVLWVLI